MPPIAVGQPINLALIHRHREQAPSHLFDLRRLKGRAKTQAISKLCLKYDIANTTKPMWEGACPR